jgi:hypothetical protein
MSEQMLSIFDGTDRRRSQSPFGGDDRRLVPLIDPAGRAAPGADDPPTEQDAFGAEPSPACDEEQQRA